MTITQGNIPQSGSAERSLRSLLAESWERGRFLCVGLDPDYGALPASVRRGRSPGAAIAHFNQRIIEATNNYVCAYKPNSAFYEAHGPEGIAALVETVRFLRAHHPNLLVILDAKRADIGNTNRGYVTAAFDVVGADAITVHPYLGKEALRPFLDRPQQGLFVLVKTSNAGAGEFQDLPVGPHGRPLYEVVARHVASDWNTNGNCGVVVGATYPAALGGIRAVVGDLPILIPGVGRQGGEIETTVRAGTGGKRKGIIVNSSRDVLYASSHGDFAEAAADIARKMNEQIADHV